MAIDVQSERLLTLAEACKALPTRPHRSTVERWRTRGCYGVVLETIVLGGRRFTSAEALDRFFRATTLAADSGGRPGKAADKAERRQRIAAAEKAVAEAGI